MILDRYNEFSNAQAETTVATHASDSVIDLQAKGDAYGKELYLVIQVQTTVTSGGAGTVLFKLETDSDEAFGSATALWTSEVIAKATLVAGYKVAAFRLPSGCERSLRVTYTIATAALTAGAFDAFLTPAPQANDFRS